MSSLLGHRWLRKFRHPSEETLLLHLDGELGLGRQRQVTAHLQNCWACRSRRDKIEQAIGAVVGGLSSVEGWEGPPRGWRTFEARLHALAVQPPEIGFWRSLAVHVGPLKYACVSAVLAALVIWTYLGSTRTVSAMEFLSRAQAAESRRLQGVGNRVAHQRVRLRLTTARARVEQVATVEFRGSGGASGVRSAPDDAVWKDVERILRANGIERPLSAAAFERWRTSIPRSHESVTRAKLEDGSDVLALETASALPHTPDTIVESTLVVRAEDWRPVEQNLTVQAVDDVVHYDLTEVAFDVQPADVISPQQYSVRRKPGSVLPPPPVLEPGAVSLPPLPAFMADLEGVEIQVRYALHHLRACLGEPIEVTRDALGGIVVRGLAETPERKEELLAALQQTPWTTVELRTTEEAMQGRPEPTMPARIAGTPGPQNAALPIQQQLEAYFKKRAESGDVSEDLASLANRASSLAQTMMAEAWAVRNLVDAYPPQRAARLNPAFQRLLQEMLEDHTAALRDKAAECRTAVEPVLSALAARGVPASGSADPAPQPGLPALFEAARDAERLTLTLFTGTTESHVRPEDAAARLLTALRDIEMHSNVVAQEFSRGSFASAAAKDAGTKRR